MFIFFLLFFSLLSANEKYIEPPEFKAEESFSHFLITFTIPKKEGKSYVTNGKKYYKGNPFDFTESQSHLFKYLRHEFEQYRKKKKDVKAMIEIYKGFINSLTEEQKFKYELYVFFTVF